MEGKECSSVVKANIREDSKKVAAKRRVKATLTSKEEMVGSQATEEEMGSVKEEGSKKMRKAEVKEGSKGEKPKKEPKQSKIKVPSKEPNSENYIVCEVSF